MTKIRNSKNFRLILIALLILIAAYMLYSLF